MFVRFSNYADGLLFFKMCIKSYSRHEFFSKHIHHLFIQQVLIVIYVWGSVLAVMWWGQNQAGIYSQRASSLMEKMNSNQMMERI